MPEKSTDHMVIKKDAPHDKLVLQCLGCKAELWIPLPVSAYAIGDYHRAFKRDHINCGKPGFGKQTGQR